MSPASRPTSRDLRTRRRAIPSRPAGRPSRPRATSHPPGDRTQRRAAIPVSVWGPARPVDPDAVWPEPIIERLVATLSAVGDRVALLAPDDTGSGPQGPVYGTTARVVVPPGTLAAAAETVEAQGRRVHVVTWSSRAADEQSSPYWARFVDPNPDASSRHGAAGAAPGPIVDAAAAPHEGSERVGAAALVVAAVGPDGVGDGFGSAAAELLQPGGTLAVITHCERRQGQLVDPSGTIVAAAQNADLLYLQHVVALHHPIRDGRITPSPARPADPAGAPQRGGHRRVHGDVYLFWRCADSAGSAELTEPHREPRGRS